MSDPTTRKLAAQVAAHALWAGTTDRAAQTSAARDAMQRRFEDEVDPTRSLPEDERIRRAKHARSAHMSRLALTRHRNNRIAAEATALADAADTEIQETA